MPFLDKNVQVKSMMKNKRQCIIKNLLQEEFDEYKINYEKKKEN
jgi:hypothetical protein